MRINAERGAGSADCDVEKKHAPTVVRLVLYSAGFTLLEVMVAVAILAMVLVTLIGVKNRSMEDVMLADHITTATMLAKRKMTEVLLSGQLAQKEDAGEFPEEEFTGYTWKQDIALIQPIENMQITEVRVQVLWKEGQRQEKVELLSYQ